MAELWYYTNEGKQMDPVSIKELKRMVTDGHLKPTDMVWKEGMPRWIRASSMKELYPDPTAALDQYFTGSKENNSSTAAPAAASNGGGAPAAKSSPAPSPAPAAASSDDEESRPRVKKRRTPSADDDDDRDGKPAGKKGGSSVGIIIALLFAGGLLLIGLVVGVILLVVFTRPAGGDAKPNPRGQRPPAVKQLPQANPADFTKVTTNFTLTVRPNAIASRNFRLRGGVEYQVSVQTDQQEVDVDLFVFNTRTNKQEAFDDSPEANALAYFTAPEDGDYRFELHNLDLRTASRSTVTIREPGIPKKTEPKEPPLPKDVKTTSGNLASVSIPPGRDQILKVRLKAGVEAKFTLTIHGTNIKKAATHLFLLKENDPAVLMSETEPSGKTLRYTPTVDETVRVRIANASKTSVTRVSLAYNLGP